MSQEPFLTFAHSDSTLTIDFYAGGAGWQGGDDESWGMDNLTVSVNPVPLPPSAALLAPALLGLAAVRRGLKG